MSSVHLSQTNDAIRGSECHESWSFRLNWSHTQRGRHPRIATLASYCRMTSISKLPDSWERGKMHSSNTCLSTTFASLQWQRALIRIFSFGADVAKNQVLVSMSKGQGGGRQTGYIKRTKPQKEKHYQAPCHLCLDPWHRYGHVVIPESVPLADLYV